MKSRTTGLNFQVGDHVKIVCNARGTVWESGYIEGFKDGEALIGYGRKHWILRADYYPVPLKELRHYF